MKSLGYILGAVPVRGTTKDGRDFSLCRISLALGNGFGTFGGYDYVYGKSAEDYRVINKMIHDAGGAPIHAEFEFAAERDFKTGKNVLRLTNFTVIK